MSLFSFAGWVRNRSLPPRRACRPRLETLEDRCVPSAGQLDPTFGSSGIVTTAVDYSSSAAAVLIQPDGKAVAAGSWTNSGQTQQGFALVRYTPSGALDPTFGSGGVVMTALSGYRGHAVTAALQSDGKIVVASLTNGKAFQDRMQYAVARYNSNGTLDRAFGKSGIVNVDMSQVDTAGTGMGQAMAYAVVIQPDGKIVVAGEGGVPDPNVSTYSDIVWSMMRCNANGSLDNTFGSGGIVHTNLWPRGVYAIRGIVVLTNGQLVVAGNCPNTGFALGRYNANGSLDSTFGSGGISTTAINGTANALLMQGDGEFVAAGSGSSGFEVGRYNADGNLDSMFGGTGIVTTATGGSANTAALQADGRIVVAGNDGHKHFALARYNSDGSYDTTFNAAVTVPTNYSYHGGAEGVAIYPAKGSANDGKIIAAGGTLTAFELARYLPSQPQIGSFTASPNPVTTGSSLTLSASSITDGNAGSSITEVAFYHLDGAGNRQ
jgi:uncharacterized delta-60 repeat protein